MPYVGTQGPNRRVASSLLALSSAAVLGVYSAGYLRTRAAADRFALQAESRRPALPAPALERTPAEVPAASEHRRAEVTTPPVGRRRIDGPVASERKRVRGNLSLEAKVINGLARAAIRAVTAPPPPATEPTAGVSTEPAPAPSAPLAAAPQAPLAPRAPDVPSYRDGTFYGWGTSRHGDIQAAVVIENGRIASATIAQCLTRYSCNVIAALPPQVAQRQSPETDYVSGATQSTNAFYYAVVEALAKAK
jgi:uncharacterized protein with FMN-binding domain